jgi:alpha-galactosidase/6-phospho-beta-glucosidase family protein
MAMNTWAMYEKYPHIKQVGLCHSVQLPILMLSLSLTRLLFLRE